MSNDYLIGSGTVRVAKRDTNGLPLALRNIGECPMIELAPNAEYIDNFETATPANKQDLHVVKRVGIKCSITMKEKTVKNLAQFLGGSIVQVAGGSVSNLAWPTGIAVGDEWNLPDQAVNVSALTIVDSAGTPMTLVNGTHYKADLKFGRVTFLATPGTQPYKASYTVAAGQIVVFLNNTGEELWLQADIIDKSKSPNQRFDVQLFRGVFDLPSKISLKGEDVATFETGFVVLADDTKPDDPTDPFGQYGRWRPIL